MHERGSSARGAEMITYKSGIYVEKGLYWDPIDGHRVNMRSGGILPGDDSKVYVRISPGGLLLVAPLFGMMFVLFLPLFGIGVFIVSWLVIIINSLAKLTMSGLQTCSRVVGRGTSFSWHPNKAHLTGSRKKSKGGGRKRKGTS
jgi:hypothetical protein